MKKNDLVKLHIRDVTLDGDGVGEVVNAKAEDNKVVFCFGAKKTDSDEIVCGKIIKTTSNYAVAKMEKQVCSEKCKAYPRCGGCTLLHFSYEETLSLKANHVKQCISRIGGVNPYFEEIIPSPTEEAYRNKTIYRFTMEAGELKAGFFKRNSHDVVSLSRCFMENDISDKIRENFTKLSSEYNLSLFDETKGKGFLRALMVRTSLSEKKAMVVIIAGFNKLPKGFVTELVKRVPEISSLYLNINNKTTNTMLGEEFVKLWGDDALTDTIGPAKFEISPQSFFQVNPHQTENLYEKAYQYANIKDGDCLLDLFCGIGTIGQYFAKRMEQESKSLRNLIGIEYTPEAIENAKNNVKINNLSCYTEYYAGDAGKVLKSLQTTPNVVVVDPPRKGMDIVAIDTLAGISTIERLVYISCGPATLARDLKLLSERGFKTEKVCPCDMFPYAGHVETVALLTRQLEDKK